MSLSLPLLQGQTAIVSGGSSDFSAAVARALAKWEAVLHQYPMEIEPNESMWSTLKGLKISLEPGLFDRIGQASEAVDAAVSRTTFQVYYVIGTTLFGDSSTSRYPALRGQR